jgi:hypothetical protein
MASVSTAAPLSQNTPVRKRKQFFKDLLITLLCLLGAFFCFFMFWKDFNDTMERSSPPIGTITFKKQAVQRRFLDRVLWTRLTQNAPVYQGDYIHTAGLSEATMDFGDDATKIKLAENTLIQIRVENGKNVIDLSGGDLSIAVPGGGAESIRVLVSGLNRVEMGPGAVLSASAGESGVFTMQVLEGSVSANGEPLGAGMSFSTLPLEERAAPLSPMPDTYFPAFSADGTALVTFTWSPLNYSGPTKLDLALDRRFRRLERSLTSRGVQDGSATESLSLSLSPGVYWWRVYPESSEAPGTSAGRIVVLPLIKPLLRSPAEGHVFYRGGEGDPGGADVRFLWDSGPWPQEFPEPGVYTLEAADSPGFENPRFSINVQGTENISLVYSGLGEGTWYWRVRQDFPGVELPAALSHFSIAPGSPPAAVPPEAAPAVPAALAPPVAPEAAPAVPATRSEPLPLLPSPGGMRPLDRFVLGPEELKRNRRLNGGKAAASFEFSWQEVPGANAYVFTLLEKTAQGLRSIVSIEGSHNSYALEDLRLLDRGSFVWRVEALRRVGDRIEQRGRPGENSFTVDIPVPGNPRVRTTGEIYGQ